MATSFRREFLVDTTVSFNTGWIPVDYHAGGVLRYAYFQASGSAHFLCRYTYGDVFNSGSASLTFYDHAVGTVSVSRGEGTFDFPIAAIQFLGSVDGATTAEIYMIQSQIAGN